MPERKTSSRKHFQDEGSLFALPTRSLWVEILKHKPRKPAYFEPERIVLCAGSLDTSERAAFVERIVSLYPRAQVEHRLDSAHNKIAPASSDPLGRHVSGKKTLVFAVHKSAVRLAEERGNTYPNYWHFSPYGFCPYGCRYCYLAGTRSVFLSPSVKIFVNLPEIWDDMRCD